MVVRDALGRPDILMRCEAPTWGTTPPDANTVPSSKLSPYKIHNHRIQTATLRSYWGVRGRNLVAPEMPSLAPLLLREKVTLTLLLIKIRQEGIWYFTRLHPLTPSQRWPR